MSTDPRGPAPHDPDPAGRYISPVAARPDLDLTLVREPGDEGEFVDALARFLAGAWLEGRRATGAPGGPATGHVGASSTGAKDVQVVGAQGTMHVARKRAGAARCWNTERRPNHPTL